MTDILVPTSAPTWSTTVGETRAVASAGLLAGPLVQCANFLLGWKLGSLKILAVSQEGVPTASPGYHRSVIQRHDSATHVLVVLGVVDFSDALTGGTITVTAGTGAATSVTVSGTSPTTAVVAAPWGALDTGHQELLIKIENCTIRSLGAWDLHRRVLDSTSDHCIDTLDATYRRAGLTEGLYVSYTGASDGLRGLAGAIVDARDDYLRQAVAWYDISQTGWSSTGAVFANPFATDFTWRHRARTYRAADSSRNYTAYLWADSDIVGADTWEWQVTTNVGGPWGSGALASGLGPGWWPADGVSIDIDCTAADDILVEVKTSKAANSVVVYGLSIVQEDHL